MSPPVPQMTRDVVDPTTGEREADGHLTVGVLYRSCVLRGVVEAHQFKPAQRASQQAVQRYANEALPDAGG